LRTTLATLGFALAATLSLGAGTLLAQQPDPLAGTWLGTLDAGGVKLRIVFNVTVDSAGARKASMDSPDQGANGIPVGSVTLTGDSVKFGVPAVMGGYDGVLATDGKSIDGTWRQGAASLPLKLEKQAGPVPQPNRPQEPKPPWPYEVEDLTWPNAAAPGVTLAGTLTTPPGEGPFPAVVLVSGSGAQNRDEALLSHKPFLVLADYLTRRGIAVLRFDDRGVGQSTGSFATATSEDFATDALAGVAFLKTRSRIDPRRIGIAGHSEGGIVAPMAAARSDDVAFIVLLAGTGLNGEQILLLQTELIARAGGAAETDIVSNRAMQEKIFAVLRSAPDSAAARTGIETIIREQIAGMTEQRRIEAGVDKADAAEAAIRAQTAQATTPWFRFFLTYEPATALRSVKVPVLAINGEKDLQVPPGQNLAAIEKALAEAGNDDVTIRELPGLNHLFQSATTGSPTEYAQIEETLNPAALQVIGDWILQRFGKAH
jgi:hypothetical protein